jgi:transcriptional regulator with XRE-family HTH domain
VTFAEKLKELRIAAGMTQPELARACGIPIGTLRDYEQGKRRNDPSLRTAAKLASALGTDCRAFAECVTDLEESPTPAARGRPRKK